MDHRQPTSCTPPAPSEQVSRRPMSREPSRGRDDLPWVRIHNPYMSTAPVLLVSGLALVVAFALLTPKLAASAKARHQAWLHEVRRPLWDKADEEHGFDLFDRSCVVFVGMDGWEQRLDHRLEDGHGREVGVALEHPRPGQWSLNGRRSRFTTVRVEVCDERGVKRLEVVRPAGLTNQPLQILDNYGQALGTLRRQGRRSFVLLDRWSQPIVWVERMSRGYAVDYTLADRSGRPLGRISDFRHLADDGTKRRLPTTEAREHVLEVSDPQMDSEHRALLLAVASSVYLALQRPLEDGG